MKNAMALSLLCAVVLFAQNYKIVGPAQPKPHEATAIKDLTDYLAKRVKGDLTIGGKKNITGRDFMRRMDMSANTFYRRVREYELRHGITEQTSA